MEVVSTRRHLEERIDGVISSFEAREATPDRWEGDWLMLALAAFRDGSFAQGEAALRKVELSASNRSAQEMANIPTSYPLLTIAEHRANFEKFRAR